MGRESAPHVYQHRLLTWNRTRVLFEDGRFVETQKYAYGSDKYPRSLTLEPAGLSLGIAWGSPMGLVRVWSVVLLQPVHHQHLDATLSKRFQQTAQPKCS